MSRRVVAVAVVGLGALCPAIASACSCTGFQKFDEIAKQSAVVFVGKIVDASPGPGQPAGTIVAYVDVEVRSVRKGGRVPAKVRIWDWAYGTSCEGGLETVRLDAEVVFAVTRVTESTDREMWEITGISPAVGDYTLGGCGDHWKELKAPLDLRSSGTNTKKPPLR